MSLWLILSIFTGTSAAAVLLWLFIPRESYYDSSQAERGSRNAAASKARICVLVLGDIGRSPRMQNHALSLATYGVAVDLVGYVDSELHPDLANHPHVTVHAIGTTPRLLQTSNSTLFLLLGPVKVLYQLWSLWAVLAHHTRPAKWLLVQNPPSIPTLFVAALVCRLRNTQFAIDWHNFGYTILALKLGENHPLVKISEAYEKWFSRSADVNFTVSEAMSRQLKREFRIKAPVRRLYDRPNPDFKPLDPEQRQEFRRSKELVEHLHGLPSPNGNYKVLVSSTSWTPDEDFSILLAALVAYDRTARGSMPQLPELIVVITGKGPQKESYVHKIQQLKLQGKLKKVTIKTAWLPTREYAKLLASADVGISLHQSSSGVDLPMKVVDMFGAGLPVVGWSMFESWSELVKENVTGRGFGSIEELKAVLIQLLSDDGQQLTRLREGVLKERDHTWDEEWRASAGRAFGVI